MPSHENQPSTSGNRVVDRAPFGFCPFCEYPIDPGICPECGTFVNPEALDEKPRSLRRRTWVRRLCVLAAAIALIFGANRFYESRVWYKWMSTASLLQSMDESRWARSEVFRRYQDNVLADNEIRQMVDQLVTVTPEIRSPHPVSESVVLRLTIRWQPCMFGLGPNAAGIPEISFAGRECVLSEVRPDWNDIISHATLLIYRCAVESPLQSGTVKVNGTVPVWVPMYRRMTVVPVHFVHEFNVNDQPLSHFVTPRTDSRIKSLLQEKCAVSICPREGRDFSVNLCVEKLGVPLVGRIDIRLDESEPPVESSTFYTSANEKLDTHDVRFTLPRGIESNETTIQVRFTPDLMLAFERGFDTCAGYSIEWLGIPLPAADKDACNVCNCCDKPYIHRPESVDLWDSAVSSTDTAR